MKKIVISFLTLMHLLCISVFAQNHVTMAPYMSKLQTSINQSWKPTYLNNGAKIVVAFKVTKTGEIKNIEIMQSSNNIEADRAAIYAIKETSGKHPLPAQYTSNEMLTEHTFDYSTVNYNKKLKQYAAALQNEVQNKWELPVLDISERIIVQLKVTKTGSFKDIKIISSSASARALVSIIGILNSLSNKHPLPASWNREYIVLELNFNSYNLNPLAKYEVTDKKKSFREYLTGL